MGKNQVPQDAWHAVASYASGAGTGDKTALKTAANGQRIAITDIYYENDGAGGTSTVKLGSTTVWTWQGMASAQQVVVNLSTPIIGAKNADLVVNVGDDSGTQQYKVTGYII